jgi:signal transduction histidine kinase
LINDILDLSKIEAGRMELDIESVDLQGIVTECMAVSEPLAQKKNLELVRDIPGNLPLILADRGRVVQVLMNLISNAVKFTPEGRVSVKIEPITSSQIPDLPVSLREGEKGPWMLIKVTDTGIGISQEDQQIIFDEFRQADSSPSRQYEGTGLGLAITRKLVDMMHGHLWLDSVVGQGSTFQVLLPLVAEASVESEIVKIEEE